MASEWVKMRGALCTNPRVLLIAEIIGTDRTVARRLGVGFDGVLHDYVTRDVTRDVTISSLLRVWCAANEHTQDGVLQNTTIEAIDQIAGVPNFGRAMVSAGWAIEDQEKLTVVLPNFLENNAPAKNNARSSGAERQQKYRDRKKKSDGNRDVTRDGNGYVTSDVTSDAREEKRRVVKTSCSELPAEAIAIELPAIGEEGVPIAKTEVDEWQRVYLGVDVAHELQVMRVWLNANPTKKKTAKGARRFVVSWLGRAQDRSKGSSPTSADVFGGAK